MIKDLKNNDQNNEIQRRVKSVMTKMEKTLQLHKKLNGSIDTLLLSLTNHKVNGQHESKAEDIRSETSKLSPQMKEIAAQFQKILEEIKHG